MPQTDANYLQTCLGAFRETSEKMYGYAFDLPAIERSVSHLRDKRPLTYTDLSYFISPRHWWFEKFWVFPPEHHVTTALKRVTFSFWQLPGKYEDKVVEGLLDVFKSIELVSIILRFIRPEHYGIISPPVERVLDVRRGNDAVETYLNYISDLRHIRQEYLLERVADADMALWVLHAKCFGSLRDPVIARAYVNDPFIIRLRTRNLMASLDGHSDAQLAQGLEEVKPNLAALIGCYRLELLIREVSELFKVALIGSGLDLDKVIDSLPNSGEINPLRKANWKRLMKVRNGLFHAGRQPTDKQRADLIKEVVQLEIDLLRLRQDRSPGTSR